MCDRIIPFLNFQPMHDLVRNEMRESFEAVYESNWFILGSCVGRFEEQYATYNGTKYAVGVSNGLDALKLALLALKIGEGDEVIVPSNTFIATALAISNVRAKIVFVEPNIRTYNIDPTCIREAITERTRAIMPVHLYGQACNLSEIMRIAVEFDLYVIEDNAQAHGASYNERLTGSWGHINATSFYPGKNLGALGDAGAITTDSEELANRINVLRNYGSSVKYHNEIIGHNMRMDELQAAFLSVKLNRLDQWTAERRSIANLYLAELNGIGDIILPFTDEDATHVYHLFVLRTKRRDSLKEYLDKERIQTLIHYPIPPHLQEAYGYLGYKEGGFPIAEELTDTSLSLPIWPGMENWMVSFITDRIKAFFK